MRSLDIVLAPWHTVRVLARAAEDLNAVAERARREPDPVDEVRARLNALSTQVETLEAGGRDLRRTAEVLDDHTQELIAGGEDLTAAAKDLAHSLRVVRGALPRLLEGMDSVEELEESVDVVAETVEPLQGVAKRVGRVSDRLSRGS